MARDTRQAGGGASQEEELMEALGAIGGSIDRLLAQRDEMVEALLGVADSDPQDDEHPCWCTNARIGNRHAAYCRAARAAVAKAEGRS